MRCLLIGNYGVTNAGDDALRDFFLQAFPGVEWQVLSTIPGEGVLPRLPAGFVSFFRTPWWKTVRAIRRADAVVFGGGSLFTDVESVRAPVIWGIHAACAIACGTPVVLAFQGIGPLQSRLSRMITRWVLRHAAFVSVRDEMSLAAAAKCGRPDVVLTADPAVLSLSGRVAGKKSAVVLIPRPHLSHDFVAAMERQHALDSTCPVRILLMQAGDPAEREIASRLQHLIPGSQIRPVPSLADVAREIVDADHVVSARYHGALTAFMMGASLTVISQGAHDKLHALQEFIRGGGTPEQLLSRAQDGVHALSHFFSSLKGR